MAENFSKNDSFDIKELATLNEDISVDFIEQLQNKVAQSASNLSENKNDGALFEEVTPTSETPATEVSTEPKENNAEQNSEQAEDVKEKVNIDDNIDDNFVKKYKAKLNKQKGGNTEPEVVSKKVTEEPVQGKDEANDIANLTSGNIVEKPIVKEQVEYNESLDYLDDNVKYSKYVIYVDPENTEFIESLTVKERKNLINKILREQDDIAITKKRFSMLQAVIKHSIIAIITIAVSVPVIYYTINASLEASINNYRNSQTFFKTLYKEKGKIKSTSSFY